MAEMSQATVREEEITPDTLPEPARPLPRFELSSSPSASSIVSCPGCSSIAACSRKRKRGASALERVRFLSISANNLMNSSWSGWPASRGSCARGSASEPDGLTPAEQLARIAEAVVFWQRPAEALA